MLNRGFLPAQEPSVDQAWKLAESGHAEQAMTLLQSYIQLHPRDAEARLLLGSLLSEAGRHEAAIVQLQEAVHLQPASSEASNALGEAFASFNQHGKARDAFARAAQLDPASGVAQLNLGRELLAQQLPQAAQPHLDLAIKHLRRNADGAEARYLRAKIFFAQSDYLHCSKDLEEAVAITPALSEAWSDLGAVRQALLDPHAALKAFAQAVALSPSDAVAQYRLGAAYLALHQPHLAIPPLQEALRLQPFDQGTLNALQKALRQDGQSAAADKITQQLATVLAARETSAEDELAAIKLNNEGAQMQRAGDLQSALQKYNAAVKLAPQNVSMRVNHAVALLRLGAWSEGLKELHTSLQMDPGNEKIQAAFRDALAQAPPAVASEWKSQSQ